MINLRKAPVLEGINVNYLYSTYHNPGSWSVFIQTLISFLERKESRKSLLKNTENGLSKEVGNIISPGHNSGEPFSSSVGGI